MVRTYSGKIGQLKNFSAGGALVGIYPTIKTSLKTGDIT